MLSTPTQAKEPGSTLSTQWKKRAAMIKADPLKQREWTDFPAYSTVSDRLVQTFCAKVSAQLVLYRNRKGEFARDWIFAAAENMPAYEWWEQYGASVPELQTVACLILSQPSSASIIERINSEFAFVKDRRRNRLGHTKANKLVALFHNLRLIKKMRKLMYSEQCVGWNDEDDKTGASLANILTFHLLSTCLTPASLLHRPLQVLRRALRAAGTPQGHGDCGACAPSRAVRGCRARN